MASDRYQLPNTPETQFEPGSDGKVLRNRLGIVSAQQMHQAEFEAYLAAQEQLYDLVAVSAVFDAAWVCRMHEMIFGAIYEWGGRYRNVNLQSVNGPPWPPQHLLPQLMASYERDVLATLTPGRPKAIGEAAHDLAVIHGELVLIHPFRDGNGRIARLLTNLVELQAGFPPPVWRVLETDQHRYFGAISSVFEKDYAPLAHLTEEALREGIGPEKAGSGG